MEFYLLLQGTTNTYQGMASSHRLAFFLEGNSASQELQGASWHIFSKSPSCTFIHQFLFFLESSHE